MSAKTWTWAAAFTGLSLGFFSVGCQSGGVGDPCTPEEEYQTKFGSFKETEVNIESRSFQCETRICLVNHFRGRVSCPYGQPDPKVRQVTGSEACYIPGSDTKVEVKVETTQHERQADSAVYCSCRCDGPDANAKYCKCPSGFSCKVVAKDLNTTGSNGTNFGSAQQSGSYCVKDGTDYDPAATSTALCDPKVSDFSCEAR